MYRDNPNIERRFFSSKLQLRAHAPTTQLIAPGVTDDETAPAEPPEEPGLLLGYAALYNTPVPYDYWTEYLVPGCFKETLASMDVVSSWNHSVDHLLGRKSAGTLRLSEDANGLNYECDVPNHYIGQYVKECVRRGDVGGLSIMFMVEDEDWDMDKEPYTRLIKKLSLYECGPVWQAASKDCKVSLHAQQRVAEARAKKLAQDAVLAREYEPQVAADLELRLRLLAI